MTSERVGLPFIRALFGLSKGESQAPSHTLSQMISSFIIPDCIPKALNSSENTVLNTPEFLGFQMIDFYAQQDEAEENLL
mmetsp:Transcript_10327/g.15830  ORF Transcript_10327/g.15830 Transcript_10327/m.15830 type:complete len:80 (+) Transcript_10327:4004-4243(+)